MEVGMTRHIGLLLIVSLIAAPVSMTQAWAQVLDKSEKEAVVARAGELLTERYIYPDRADKAKAKITQALANGDYETITDPLNFAERLTSDLQSVTHDKHMRVFLIAPNPEPAPASSSPVPRTNGGFAAVDRLNGNVGYIKLNGFPPIGPFQPVADQAMADLADTKALIIDVRDNGGGDPESVAYLCSFFFDPRKPVHINDLIWRNTGTDTYRREEFWTKSVPIFYKKPVYLLSSSRTFSGGEEFLYDLKTQKRAKLIGQLTGGGANPGGAPPVNARFAFFIPGGRAENPITKTNWEGTGVAPDIAVAPEHALRVAMLEITGDKRLASEPPMEAGAFEPVRLLKFRDGPQPGGAQALKRLLEQTALGKPDYASMSEGLAKAVREQLPKTQADLAALGEIKSVTFQNIGSAGLDVYEVVCANGKLMSGIFLSGDGKIATNWLRLIPTSAR
ncbi:hypothetical protein AYO42_00920 [Rhizomicrobium sp. SCGC AG-212-E05]|nr:hypothetical protein AYO42_00920 [Rhizomicrobium sp. SCGC AG-212-E05]